MLPALSFDDVVLLPRYSEIESRSDPDTTCALFDMMLKSPIISSNMDTVTDSNMAIAMWKHGGVGALHRFMSAEMNVAEYRRIKHFEADCLVTIGVKDWQERSALLYGAGARNFIIDIAHGHSILMKRALEGMRNEYKDVKIVAGNIATSEAVRDLKDWGADILKIGVGGGSICKTRIVTGHGLPMFSSVHECARIASMLGIKTIADGGIRSSGDIVKALVAGADYVMLGSLLAGCNETPGKEVAMADGTRMKEYRGMASAEARADRHWGSNLLQSAPEGVQTQIPAKGPLVDVMMELIMGLKSGMSYCNSRKLSEMPGHSVWRTQTHSAHIEGTPHILRK